MLSPLPRRSDWDHSCSITQPYQPSPKWRSGRPAQRPFRGLLSVHSRYGLHTRAATIFAARFTGGFNRFVTSTVAPVASGWSRLPGGTCTHWESAALTRRTPKAAARLLIVNVCFVDSMAIRRIGPPPFFRSGRPLEHSSETIPRRSANLYIPASECFRQPRPL